MIPAISHLGLLDDEDILLDLAALELSALDHEGTSLDPYIDLLKDLEDRLASAAGTASHGIRQGEILAELLAGDYGFAGDRETYDAPLNADMIRVLDRRRGLPVSLSILYVALARRISPFIRPFPEAYRRVVLQPDYAPTSGQFVDDYLAHNINYLRDVLGVRLPPPG